MAGEEIVAPPQTVVTEHGLLTSAYQVLNDGPEARWPGSGIMFLPPPCAGPRGFSPVCETPASDDLDVIADGKSFVTVRPAVYYATDLCTLPLVVSGASDPVGRARTSVALGLQAELERELWEGTYAGPQSVTLTASPTVITATAVDLATGIGLLEDALGTPGLAGGVGTIHVPAIVGSLLLNGGGLVKEAGPRLRTMSKGHTVIIGDGYSGSAPGNVAPAANVLWLYATGPVVVRLAPAREFDPTAENGRHASRINNVAEGIVQQPAIAYHDTCRKFAVPVIVTGAPATAAATAWSGSGDALDLGEGSGLVSRPWAGNGGALTVAGGSGSFAADGVAPAVAGSTGALTITPASGTLT